MKIAARSIDGFIKKPDPSALAILVYGPDEGLARERMTALAKTVVADPNDPFNVAELTESQLAENPARLTDEAKSISMLGGRRVVRLRGATDKSASAVKDAVKALQKGDNLILVEAGELGPRSALRLLFEQEANAAAIACYVDDERDISRVIADSLREQGFRITSDALSLFASSVTGDRAVARGEIEKLVTYMGPLKDISVEDVAACAGSAAHLPLDDLARHVALGRFADADRILSFVLSEGLPAVTALRALQNHFMRLHVTRSRIQKGDGTEMALSKLKPPVFFKQKPAITHQLEVLSAEQIEQALNIIVSAEGRCKQTGAVPEIIASRALLALCQLMSRAAARRRA